MLASLALLTATVWLANWDESKQLISTGVPMVLMAAMTILAIVQNFVQKFLSASWMANATYFEMASAVIQIVLAFVLVGLALELIRIGYGNIQEARDEHDTIIADGGGPNDD